MYIFLCACLLLTAHARQVPLFTAEPFGKPADLSNRVFASLHGLFKGWNQAYAPNGRAVLPVTIPKGTLLYHGRGEGMPQGLDWFALDAEHAYGFGRGGKLLTYATTRDIPALAFDGFSAAKMDTGTLDQQQVLVYGRVSKIRRPRPPMEGTGTLPPHPPAGPDSGMMKELCDRYSRHGIAGFVREEATFELAACDIDSGDFTLINVVNTSIIMTEPGDNDRDRTGPPIHHDNNPYFWPSRWAFLRAASWHHHVADQRIIPHPQYMVSLYDEHRYPSLSRNNRAPIYEHRLEGMSAADVESWRQEIDQSLDDWHKGTARGVDWISVAQASHDRYFGYLAELQVILHNETTVANNATQIVARVGALGFAALLPHLDGDIFSIWPKVPSASRRAKSLAQAVRSCEGAFTEHLASDTMSAQEVRLRSAIEGVQARICGLSASLIGEALILLEDEPQPGRSEMVAKIRHWRSRVDHLIDWLAWPEFKRCDRQCEWDELCAVDMWPALNQGDGTGEPKPRCLRSEDLVALVRPTSSDRRTMLV